MPLNEETQPLPNIRPFLRHEETSQERFRRLKAIADATGVRFLLVYREDERRRARQMTGIPKKKDICRPVFTSRSGQPSE